MIRPSKQTYWKHVSQYAQVAIGMAKGNTSRLGQLIEHIHNFPEEEVKLLLDYIRSEEVLHLPEIDRSEVWRKLTAYIATQKRYASKDNTRESPLLKDIEDAAGRIAPASPKNLYVDLFSHGAFHLFDGDDGYERQHENLEKARRQAIDAIIKEGGVEELIEFSKRVECPDHVGTSASGLDTVEIDQKLLPAYLETTEEHLKRFIGGYIWGRHRAKGWGWVDSIVKDVWPSQQIATFFICLPFSTEAWERAEKLLSSNESQYWKKTPARAFQYDKNLPFAVDKLLEHGRPRAAIDCLQVMQWHTKRVDHSLAFKALRDAITSSEHLDAYHVVELIKALQEDPTTDQDQLLSIEWAYLELLDRNSRASPMTLEGRLSTDPGFFCEMIGLMYRSSKSKPPRKEPTEQEKLKASNAFRLLYHWNRPPGTQDDGRFSCELFNNWIESVREKAEASGHLKVALSHVGAVLIHCPSDPDGLWIIRCVAEALNGKDAGEMRRGYRDAWIGSRGVHTVDPTGQSERDLAHKYRTRGGDVENAGYVRLGTALKDIADYYNREAVRIVEEHQHRKQ